jgi:hypothetical protein
MFFDILQNMHQPSLEHVYHGSHEKFETVIPKRQIRKGKNPDGDGYVTVFDDVSFHATPYKWIAIQYMCRHQNYTYQGKDYWIAPAVSLKKYKEEIEIYGVESLEKSLEILYGQGGYLYTFDTKDFFHQEGLGALERIVKSEIKPLSVERVDDPVAELKKMGISLIFKDLTLPENQWDI